MSNQGSSQAPKVPKVRQSCDTCQTSKIRCGQERPSCRRCTKYNIVCVYSVSRRAGRPRPKRTTANPSTPKQNSSSTPSQSPSNPQISLPTPDGISPMRHGCEPTLASPSRNAAPSDSLQGQLDGLLASPDKELNINNEQDRRNSDRLKSGQCGFEIGLAQDNSISYSNNSSCRSDGSSSSSTESIASTNTSICNEFNSSADGTIHLPHNHCQDLDFSPDLSSSQQPNYFSHVDSRQFSTFFLSEVDLDAHLDSHQPMDFVSLLSPLADDMAALPLDSSFAHASSTGALPGMSEVNGVADNCMNASAIPVPNMVPTTACQCTGMLLQHLGEVANNSTLAGDKGPGEEAYLASAVQCSRVLLDHCVAVLSCPLCSTRMSSALVLCQAMDELSMTLGMGTLWTDGGSNSSSGASAYEQDRLPLISNLAKDEVRLRCGSYAVRGMDRQVLLRTLMMGRLEEMQQAMGKLCQAVETLSSPCRSACARMAVELERRVSSKVDSFRAAAAT